MAEIKMVRNPQLIEVSSDGDTIKIIEDMWNDVMSNPDRSPSNAGILIFSNLSGEIQVDYSGTEINDDSGKFISGNNFIPVLKGRNVMVKSLSNQTATITLLNK